MTFTRVGSLWAFGGMFEELGGSLRGFPSCCFKTSADVFGIRFTTRLCFDSGPCAFAHLTEYFHCQYIAETQPFIIVYHLVHWTLFHNIVPVIHHWYWMIFELLNAYWQTNYDCTRWQRPKFHITFHQFSGEPTSVSAEISSSSSTWDMAKWATGENPKQQLSETLEKEQIVLGRSSSCQMTY